MSTVAAEWASSGGEPDPDAGQLFPAADGVPGPVQPQERDALDGFATQLRRALDTIARARPPAQVWREAAEHVRAITAMVEPFGVPERDRIVGQVRELPGRGQTFVPAIRVLHRDANAVRAEVVLDETHLGANGAAHGGVLPLIFDELLGQHANTGGRPKARTAYLHVDYRKIAPIGVALALEASFEREEGRKRYLRGSARAGDDVVVEVHGLFVQLRPGQP